MPGSGVDELVREMRSFCEQLRGQPVTVVRDEWERRFPDAGPLPELWAALARGDTVRVDRLKV